MKPRFTPALAYYLEGYGFPVKIESIGKHIIIDIELKKLNDDEIIEYKKELQKLSVTECTNG